MHLFVKKKNMTFFQGPAKKNVIIVGEDMKKIQMQAKQKREERRMMVS